MKACSLFAPIPIQRISILFILVLFSLVGYTQDSIYLYQRKEVVLKEVVVHSKLNVPGLIDRLQRDTSFYKAFRNLRVLSYSAWNDVRMFDKRNAVEASYQSKTRQHAAAGCRITEVVQEQAKGPIRNRQGEWNYFTLQLYASLFFAVDTLCGETNVVGDSRRSLAGKAGMDKRKEQLKMLFFDPGKRIPGLPLIGNKTALFEDRMMEEYDYTIDLETLGGESVYTLLIKAKPKSDGTLRGDLVVQEMKTSFDAQSLDIVARTYHLRYDAGVYDFDVRMEVELTRFQELLVPSLIRYQGNWFALTQKRERGVFTATLFDFQR